MTIFKADKRGAGRRLQGGEFVIRSFTKLLKSADAGRHVQGFLSSGAHPQYFCLNTGEVLTFVEQAGR